MNKVMYAPARRIAWRKKEIQRVLGSSDWLRKMTVFLITLEVFYMLLSAGAISVVEKNIKKTVEMQNENLIKWGIQFDEDGIHIYRSEIKYD